MSDIKVQTSYPYSSDDAPHIIQIPGMIYGSQYPGEAAIRYSFFIQDMQSAYFHPMLPFTLHARIENPAATFRTQQAAWNLSEREKVVSKLEAEHRALTLAIESAKNRP